MRCYDLRGRNYCIALEAAAHAVIFYVITSHHGNHHLEKSISLYYANALCHT